MQNVNRVLDDLTLCVNEFQIVGAAKEKNLRPLADVISGMTRNCMLPERSEGVQEGVQVVGYRCRWCGSCAAADAVHIINGMLSILYIVKALIEIARESKSR